MLIRSYDREELINLDICNLTVVGGNIRAYSPMNDNYYTTIGRYSYKERAKEVLDDIAEQYAAPHMAVPHVYQMPEE